MRVLPTAYWLVVTSCMGLLGCAPDNNLALGTLERDRILLKATAAEIVTQLPVAEGKDVQAGDLIVQLDDSRQQARVNKAHASVAAAEAYLAKLQHGARSEDIAAARSLVDGAKAQVLEAQKNYERSTTLANKKLVGAAEVDAARAKRDSAQATLNHAHESLLALTNGTRVEDLQQAEAQVELAQASLMLEQQSLRELSARATHAGRLDYLPKNLGERTSVGETIAVLLSDAAPYARVYVPQTQRLRLNIGQSIPVHIDGLADPVSGTLRWISQDPAFTPYFALNSSDRARLVYMAEVELPVASGHLPSGLPVQVELPHE